MATTTPATTIPASSSGCVGRAGRLGFLQFLALGARLLAALLAREVLLLAVIEVIQTKLLQVSVQRCLSTSDGAHRGRPFGAGGR